jgi:hypothetical protein
MQYYCDILYFQMRRPILLVYYTASPQTVITLMAFTRDDNPKGMDG